MDVTIIQTCDAAFYYPMLQETAKTVRRYCVDNGYRYEQFVGVKRGSMPWHSGYNRIYMLKEMLDRGTRGWVLYMDADSMIVDHGFDLRRYFDTHGHLAGIFAGYQQSELPYAINSGGFAINFDHPLGRSIVYDYWRITEEIPSVDFHNAVFWGPDIYEDQYLLHLVLQRYVEIQNCGQHLLFERPENGYVNNGEFISQVLRVAHSDFETRLAAIRSRVEEILLALPPEREERNPGIYMTATHPRLHTDCGSKKHSAIISKGVGGMLLYGPYITLPAGHWTARVHGEVKLGIAHSPVVIRSDVTADAGGYHLAQDTFAFSRSTKGVLIEHQFSLDHATAGLETRVMIEHGQEVIIFAVEICRR